MWPAALADVSFGVEAAARQFDLDFVRLLTEDYFFVCRTQTLEDDAVKQVLVVMRSKEFHDAVSALPGYTVNACGEVQTVREVLRTPV